MFCIISENSVQSTYVCVPRSGAALCVCTHCEVLGSASEKRIYYFDGRYEVVVVVVVVAAERRCGFIFRTRNSRRVFSTQIDDMEQIRTRNERGVEQKDRKTTKMIKLKAYIF